MARRPPLPGPQKKEKGPWASAREGGCSDFLYTQAGLGGRAGVSYRVLKAYKPWPLHFSLGLLCHFQWSLPNDLRARACLLQLRNVALLGGGGARGRRELRKRLRRSVPLMTGWKEGEVQTESPERQPATLGLPQVALGPGLL